MRIIICVILAACVLIAGCGGPSSLNTTQSSSDFNDMGSSLGTQQGKPMGMSGTSSIWDMQALKAKPNVETVSESTDHNVRIQKLYYESPAAGGDMLKIFAYYAYPLAKKGQKLPAIITVDGRTGLASKEAVVEWTSRGYAALSMDLSGKEKSRPESGISEASIFETQPSPKNSFLFPAVNSVCRGVSVLSNRPEVDKSRIGMIGSRWGGVITLIVNGIDTRISAACTTCGAGYIDEDNKSKSKNRDWKEYYDPSSYLANLHGRTLFVGATQDASCSLRSMMQTYDAAQCEKTLCLVPNNSRELDDAAKITIVKWFDWALRSGAALPKIKLAKSKGNLAITAKGGNAVTDVKLYTADSSDLTKVDWKASDMKGKDGVWTTDQPSANTSYFIAAKDDTGALVAAELHLPNDNKMQARKPENSKPGKRP